jgi:hypothetical protein
VSARETEINAVNPFINEHPFLLDGLKRVHHINEWWLLDEDGKFNATAKTVSATLESVVNKRRQAFGDSSNWERK